MEFNIFFIIFFLIWILIGIKIIHKINYYYYETIIKFNIIYFLFLNTEL